MHSRFLFAPLFAFALTAALAVPGQANGLIVVSGDANITDALVRSSTNANVGNETLFANILGKGSHVLIGQTDPFGKYASMTYSNDFYNSLAGVTSTISYARITTASLTGADLFISTFEDSSYSTGELAALTAFSARGGSIFLMGEARIFASQNDILNTLLTSLGSGMRIVSDEIDSDFHTVSGSHIVSGNALTANVGSLTYAYTSRVTGGTSLVTASGNQTFIAAENLPGVAAVAPEPNSIALFFACGVPALGLVRRRKAGKATR